MDNFWLVLLGMSCITFTCRYMFFTSTIPFRLGPKIQRALSYTAPSVLTAMWAPIVFTGHQETDYSLMTSPFLYAGLFTLLLSFKVDNTLFVVTAGMSTFAALKLVF